MTEVDEPMFNLYTLTLPSFIPIVKYRESLDMDAELIGTVPDKVWKRTYPTVEFL